MSGQISFVPLVRLYVVHAMRVSQDVKTEFEETFYRRRLLIFLLQKQMENFTGFMESK